MQYKFPGIIEPAVIQFSFTEQSQSAMRFRSREFEDIFTENLAGKMTQEINEQM